MTNTRAQLCSPCWKSALRTQSKSAPPQSMSSPSPHHCSNPLCRRWAHLHVSLRSRRRWRLSKSKGISKFRMQEREREHSPKYQASFDIKPSSAKTSGNRMAKKEGSEYLGTSHLGLVRRNPRMCPSISKYSIRNSLHSPDLLLTIHYWRCVSINDRASVVTTCSGKYCVCCKNQQRIRGRAHYDYLVSKPE